MNLDNDMTSDALKNLQKSRDRERRQRLETETLFEGLRILVNPASIERMFSDLMEVIRKLIPVARACIFRFSNDLTLISATHEWRTEETASEMINLQNLFINAFPWLMKKLRCGEAINIRNAEELPSEAAAEIGILKAHELRSLLIIPFSVENSLAGFIGFEHSSRSDKWSDEDVILLQTVAAIFGNAFERKLSHDRLRENETKYRDLVERASDGITIIQDDIIRYANPQIAKLGGYSQREVIGKSFAQFVHPTQRETMTDTLRRRLRGEKVIPVYETVLLRRDGSPLEVEISAGVIPYEGRPADLVLVRDISQRKHAAEALRESEERFRAIATVAKDGICIVDHEGRISYWNPAAVISFGYSPKDACKKPFSMVFEGGRVPAAIQAIFSAETAETAAPLHHSQEFNAVNSAGKVFSAEISLSSFSIRGQRHYLAILRDITGRKRMQTLTHHSQKMEAIGTLAAGIAHEINTPTQYVGGNLEFLESAFDKTRTVIETVKAKTQEFSPEHSMDLQAEILRILADADFEFMSEEIPHALAEAREGVKRVTKIVSAMREFAHPGKQKMAATDLNNAIESTITVSRNEWKYHADLTADLDPNLPLVPCLKDEFNQVVLNIIVNASHAIADAVADKPGTKGKIHISTRVVDKWAEVRISDTGSGIPEAIQTRIFDPFFTTKEAGSGTGQGLAIAHAAIVEKHQGAITFETEMGKGTTFIIRMPLKAQGEE